MTKKQRKKVIVKILPGEAVFVASADILQHIIATYEVMGSDCEDKDEADSWFSVANEVRDWLGKTYYSGEFNQDEEE